MLPAKIDSRDSNVTLKSFLSNFISDRFFIDFVRIELYPADFYSLSANSGTNTVIEYFKKYFTDLIKTCEKIKLLNLNQIRRNITVVSSILNIRESRLAIINYDNILRHLNSLDQSQLNIINESVKNRIRDLTEFRMNVNQIINTIQAFYEVCSISSSIASFDRFSDYATQSNVTPFEAITMYKNSVLALYNDISKLRTVNKYETEKDYYIIGDKKSSRLLAKELVNYLATGYSFFKTGVDMIDSTIEGFESASIHLISAPSNHGKSILMINLAKKIIELNIEDFKETDCVLFITLEDTIQKVIRRFSSIFGNIRQKSVKKLYTKSYEAIKTNEAKGDSDKALLDKIEILFDDTLIHSIHKVADGKINLVIKHHQENLFSAGDIGKFMDRLKIEGLNVKLLFVDYLDVMTPSMDQSNNEYTDQGKITQELRNLSQIYKIPIISATQNTRGSDNVNYSMSSNMVGDSIKKVRYSDFIYMVRQDTSKDPFDPALKDSVMVGDLIDPTSNKISSTLLRIKNKICEDLIPLEMKITKSKDGGRDQSNYMLFCQTNLRIYNNLQEYLNDIDELENNSNELEKEITFLDNFILSSYSEELLPHDNSYLFQTEEDVTNIFEGEFVTEPEFV